MSRGGGNWNRAAGAFRRSGGSACCGWFPRNPGRQGVRHAWNAAVPCGGTASDQSSQTGGIRRMRNFRNSSIRRKTGVEWDNPWKKVGQARRRQAQKPGRGGFTGEGAPGGVKSEAFCLIPAFRSGGIEAICRHALAGPGWTTELPTVGARGTDSADVAGNLRGGSLHGALFRPACFQPLCL